MTRYGEALLALAKIAAGLKHPFGKDQDSGLARKRANVKQIETIVTTLVKHHASNDCTQATFDRD